MWSPKPRELRRDELVVFGAEQKVRGNKEPLVVGSTGSLVDKYHEAFLRSLELAGIPRKTLHSQYVHVGRGKIWPTFVARITQENFRTIKQEK
ncbi:MAG: hypothetical protein AAB589_01245 [Patescibacteria group bacterium]